MAHYDARPPRRARQLGLLLGYAASPERELRAGVKIFVEVVREMQMRQGAAALEQR